MREAPDGTNQFNGVAKDVAPAALPAGLFQTDHGSSRYFRGSWARRKGMLRSELAQFNGAVVAILGFELPGGDYALMIAEGTNVHGFTNVTEQDFTLASNEGWGETEFGESFGD